MGIMDKIKELAKLTDEGYSDDMDNRDDYDDYVDDGYEEEENDIYSGREESYNSRRVSYKSSEKQNTGNIVGISSGGRSQVVFKKLDKFEEVGPVADVLKEKKIVILNLETCPNDVSRRVLDFLYGVAYANNGEIKRVAGRAYIIAPNNVPVTGEMLDEIESGSANLG